MRKTPIRKVSKKMAVQKVKEAKLTQELLAESNGLCQDCGLPPDWRGLSKHEVIFRSHGGDPLDRTNVWILCGPCHNLRHGIKEK